MAKKKPVSDAQRKWMHGPGASKMKKVAKGTAPTRSRKNCK